MKIAKDPPPKSGPRKPIQPKRRNRDWLGALRGFFVGACGLLLGRLGIIWPSFDIFSQFFMAFALLTVGAAFGLCLPRLKGLSALAITLVLCVAYGLWPLLEKSGPELALNPGEMRLSVASFNVHSSASPQAGIAKAIQDLNPDVAALVEYNTSDRSALAALKSQWPYQIDDCVAGWSCEYAIVSKFPITLSRRNLHFLAVNFGPRFGNTEFVAMHTLHFPYTMGQAAQLNEIADIYAQRTGQIIFAGDFNATPFSVLLRRFAERLGLTRLTSLPTWPANKALPFLAIDHILAGGAIRALDQEIIGNGPGSDHFPIRLTLAVNVTQN